MKVERILEFQDLFPYEKDFDIKNVLCRYNRLRIMHVVNCLGFNFGNAYLPDPKNPFFSDISRKRVNEISPLFNRFLDENKVDKVIFCTQRSILELMRITFSIPVHDFQDNGNDEDMEYDFFRAILHINQQLMGFNSSSDIKEISILTFLLSFILNDVTGTDWKQCLQTQIYYIDRLAEFLETSPQGKELKEEFLNNVSISSFNEYIQTLIALISLYVDEQKKNRKSCPIFDLDILQDNTGFIHKSVCDYISLDINAFIPYDNENLQSRENNIDYREFRSHPLVKISESGYFIYNLPLLCERLYNSMFFDLKEFWKRGDYFQFYNSEVVEHHIFHKTMLMCIGKKSKYFYPSKDEILSVEKKPESTHQPDFYIRENNALILFECKGIKLNGSLKDKADVDELIRVIKNKLYFFSGNIDPDRRSKKSDKLVGVTQLVKQINLIEDDNFIWDNQIPNDVAYYPVLVLEDPKLSQIGLTTIINNWYQPLIKEELAETLSRPIIVMSIDTLFLFSETFKELGFRTVFELFFKKNTMDGASGVDWHLNQLADFNSFMRDTFKISSAKQTYAKRLIEKKS